MNLCLIERCGILWYDWTRSVMDYSRNWWL